jgi:hypothetical protein
MLAVPAGIQLPTRLAMLPVRVKSSRMWAQVAAISELAEMKKRAPLAV